MFKRHKLGLAAAIGLIIVCVANPANAAAPQGLGRSSTLLPDGSILQAGGFGADSFPLSDAVVITAGGAPRKLASGLNVARAGHTATVLPDGTVFIFGGVDADGKVVATAESFDPATQRFSLLPEVFATPRAFHTATLLTDGTLLLAGGVLAGGAFPDDVQLWDYRTRKALSYHALLMTPREGHTAKLLSDGGVRLSGGTDHFGRLVQADEVYDPVTRRFRFSPSGAMPDESDTTAPRIAASIPEDGATDVAIQDPIAIRFSRLVSIATVNAGTLVLSAPDGSQVPATATGAEAGRLAFVLPAAPLLPGTSYVLRVQGVADPEGQELPETSITFQTAGAPPDGPGPDWTPGLGWTTGTGASKWQELPALAAAPRITALAGQVLKLNGWPLEHVTLEIDGKRVHSDGTGRFLLQGLTAGHHVLWIEGSTANHQNAAYGTYEVGVTILAGRTNVLNYTIWMTRLDVLHAVNIPSPTTSETVITNPALPGLELHLPPNTTITDRYGRIVRQVSITPIPLDKPPFPLPAGVEVPIYFTIQPGGAYIKVQNLGSGPAGARLIYPNAMNLKPGTTFSFWNYDADARGWYIYGQGQVSADGRSVVPDPRVEIYEFTGAMVAGPGDAPGKGKPAGAGANDGDPVDLSTGQFIYRKTDLVVPDVIPITLNRTYITNDSFSRSFGIGATKDYDMFMVGDRTPYTYQELILPDGGRIRFDRISMGTDNFSAVYLHTTSHTKFYGALLSWNTNTNLPGSWKIVLRDGTTYSFPDSSGANNNPECQALMQITDRYGNAVRLTRDSSGFCRLTQITSPNGRSISLTYDSQSRVTQASDISGRIVTYVYDAAGRLSTVTDPSGGVTTYTYDDQNRMLTIQDPRGIIFLTNQYDSAGRVRQQTQADGGIYTFSWTPSSNPQQLHFYQSPGGGGGSVLIVNGCWGAGGYARYTPGCGEGYMPLVAQVDVTDPRGYVREVKFNSTGYPASDTHALGQPEQQTTTYSYYSDNLLKSVTDTLGRVTSFDYDGLGRPTRVTRLDGTSNAVTSTAVYAAIFSQLSAAHDPLNHGVNVFYDNSGNMIDSVDTLGRHTKPTYNAAGQMLTVSDPLNHTAQFAYFGADLSSKIDPLGNVTSEFHDVLGRITQVTDALGQISRFQYNVLNQVQTFTDPKGNVSSYTYDPNGNPLSLTDAKAHTTSYTYDNMDRRVMRTDALQRVESYAYDLNGNISTVTDRKGQVQAFTYDGLNRMTSVCFNQVVNGGVTSCASTITYQYDLPNRRVIITDSLSGTITKTYDDLGRLVSEVNPHGSVSYSYDAGGRMTGKTIAGQTPFTYTYNDDNQVLSITQGTQSVQMVYDLSGRVTSMTLPNGMVAGYSYDNGSRLTGISYTRNGVTIGSLVYSYDVLNRRVGVSGSLASTMLPPALTSATYDAANQVATWNGATFTYDANGSLISDGQNTYSWDGRGQLASITGGITAGFGYDALGRRISKSVGPNALGFIYDNSGITQELTGGNVTATIWSGGSNGFIERTDSSGTLFPLTDALGSVLALTDSNGNLLTQYFYDPFGATTSTGMASGNPSQYIGRENDLTGLYYMHARYYSPALMRFISEDPLGFAGGDVNLHAYSINSPTNLRDPNGTNPLVVGCILGASADVALNLYADYATGRKTSWQDAFSWRTVGYAERGCVWGAFFGLLGAGAQVIAETMFPIGVGALLADEMGLAAGAAGGAADAVATSSNEIGLAGEEAVSDFLAIPRNVGPGQVTVPGTGPGGFRVPDFDPDLTIPSRGTVVEVKNVQDLQISDQIRDLVDYANNTRGVPLEIFTNGSLPGDGELARLIQSGAIRITPIP